MIFIVDVKIEMKICQLVFICLLCFAKLSGGTWYSEYWQQFQWKTYSSDRFEVRSFARLETENHWQHLRAFLLSEQLAYKKNKDTSLEFHYTYIHGHSLISPIWGWQHRLEFEFNHIFRLLCDNQLITRNRLELRWRENSRPRPDLRFRHRTTYFVPLKTSIGLKAFSLSNEIFYDISKGDFTQDRICPCQLTFGVAENVDLDVFLMLRLLVQGDQLCKSVLLGTQLNF